MAYSIGWNEAQPDGAVVDAKDLDLEIRNLKIAMRERLEQVIFEWSTDATDPKVLVAGSARVNVSTTDPGVPGGVDREGFVWYRSDLEALYVYEAPPNSYTKIFGAQQRSGTYLPGTGFTGGPFRGFHFMLIIDANTANGGAIDIDLDDFPADLELGFVGNRSFVGMVGFVRTGVSGAAYVQNWSGPGGNVIRVGVRDVNGAALANGLPVNINVVLYFRENFV
ncbi:MAG: hypothetical protein GY906_37075 [bacterium]|nr:hypothetical protein [bacterium]